MTDDSMLTSDEMGTGDPRCPLILLLDTSSSMGVQPNAELNELPIAQLNAGLQTLAKELNADSVAKRRVEVLVVPFGGTVAKQGDFTLAWDWAPPYLSAGGGTPMGAAVRYGLEMANERRRQIQQEGTVSYCPWVFLLTDGQPTDSMEGVADAVASAESDKKAIFWSIAAVGADERVLKSLTPGKPVLRLDATDWNSLFKWMSAAMSSVSRSTPGDAVNLPAWTITA